MIFATGFRSARFLALALGAACGLLVSSATAALIAEYDSSAGTPQSPASQGWTATEVIEEDPSHPLATAINTTGDGSLANAGAGTTGWVIRDYLDGQADGGDDRPEYNQTLTAADFAAMQNQGWRYTVVFKMDSVDADQEMRLMSIDQGGGQYLPFDLKVNARYAGADDELDSSLVLRIPIEDGVGTGTYTSFDTGLPAGVFHTLVFEDPEGDSTFTITVDGSPLQNTVDSSYVFDSTPNDGDVPGDDVIVIGANSTAGDGGGIEYALVRLETIPEPGTIAMLLCGVVGLAARRRR